MEVEEARSHCQALNGTNRYMPSPASARISPSNIYSRLDFRVRKPPPLPFPPFPSPPSLILSFSARLQVVTMTRRAVVNRGDTPHGTLRAVRNVKHPPRGANSSSCWPFNKISRVHCAITVFAAEPRGDYQHSPLLLPPPLSFSSRFSVTSRMHETRR